MEPERPNTPPDPLGQRRATLEKPLSTLRERLGQSMQRERQRHGLSQSQLAKLANLSLKYVGEIERGEANLTMDALEQIATALQWNPFEVSVPERDALPEGLRTLVLAELFHVQHVVQTAIGWLERADTTFAPRAVVQAQAARAHGPWQYEDDSPIRRRGRPRKPKDQPPPTGSE